MDSSEFPGSLGSLSLPDKPLIGDLPAEMEFGGDLLASQTASIPQDSALPSQEMEWEEAKQAASEGDVDLALEKADELPERRKPDSLALEKSAALDLLEKPGLLDNLGKEDDVVILEKPENADSLYQAHGTVDPEDGPGDPPGSATEALVPETWAEESVPKADSGGPQEDGAPSTASLPDSHAAESPDVVEVSSTPPSQEAAATATATATATAAASPSSSPTSQRPAKKARLKSPRKSSPVRKDEGAASAEEGKEAACNSVPNATPEPGTQSPPEAEKEDSSTLQKEPSESKAQETEPSAPLPGDGPDAKGNEQPVVKEPKRSERARRAEVNRPEIVNSSESIPVSDEDSDAMVDDPNDEDFVPSRTPRRTTRMSLRNQMAQRAARSTVTKMTCANCRTPLQKGQTAYQRKGLPQLFCSSSCLTTYSKRPLSKKTCTFCKKEIWNTKDSVVAQVGSGSSFHEFCTSACLSLYEAQQQKPAPQAGETTDTIRCSVCYKAGEIQHEVSNGNVVHRLCSDACFTKFRATKGLKTNCCDQCGLYLYNKGLPLEYLFHEGQQKRFCNATCLNNYKKKNTRVYQCMWCKTLCKNFDMMSHKDRNGKLSLFCSVCCTTSFKVKQAGLTGPPRPCSFCRKTMTEISYYNKNEQVVYQFCSPSCWTKFQVHTEALPPSQ